MCGCENPCSVRHLGFDYDKPQHFTSSQWPVSRAVYIVYRVVVSLYFLAWLIVSGVRFKYGGYWFLLLTNLSFLSLNISIHCQLAAALYACFYKQKCMRMSLPIKLSWVMYNSSSAIAIVVSLAYWILLHGKYGRDSGIHVQSFHTHAVNSIYVITDLFITAIPIRLMHAYQGVCWGLLYCILTIIYSLLTGNTIYSILDWKNKPRETSIYAVVILVAVVLSWVMIYLLYLLRSAIYNKCFNTQKSRSFEGEDNVAMDESIESHKV